MRELGNQSRCDTGERERGRGKEQEADTDKPEGKQIEKQNERAGTEGAKCEECI